MFFVSRMNQSLEANGFCFWAVDEVETETFVGFVGLWRPTYSLPFTPCVEIGWRLQPQFWGFGYATEAAQKALGIGFDDLGLPEIVSFTVPQNLRSQRVMARLGMTRHRKIWERHRLYCWSQR